MCAAVASGAVHVFDLTGQCVASDLTAQPAGFLTSVAFHPSSLLLAFIKVDHVAVWRLHVLPGGRRCLASKTRDENPRRVPEVTAAEEDEEAKHMSCSSKVVWTSGETVVGMSSLAWDSSGMLIAAAGAKSVRVYDVAGAPGSPVLLYADSALLMQTRMARPVAFGNGHDMRHHRALACGVLGGVALVRAPEEPRWSVAAHGRWLQVFPHVGVFVTTMFLTAHRLAAAAAAAADAGGGAASATATDSGCATQPCKALREPGASVLPSLPTEMWCAVLCNLRAGDMLRCE